jgi:hypothetical protein
MPLLKVLSGGRVPGSRGTDQSEADQRYFRIENCRCRGRETVSAVLKEEGGISVKAKPIVSIVHLEVAVSLFSLDSRESTHTD